MCAVCMFVCYVVSVCVCVGVCVVCVVCMFFVCMYVCCMYVCVCSVCGMFEVCDVCMCVWCVCAEFFLVYLQVVLSESSKESTHLLGSHASLPPELVNCAVQYLRRLSQDLPSQSVQSSIQTLDVIVNLWK